MSQDTAAASLEFDVADRMRKALRVADVSVAEMGEYLGVSRNTVGRYINGHVEPDRRTLRLWALRCGVPLDWLEGHFVGTPVRVADGDWGPPRLTNADNPSGLSDAPSAEEILAFRRQFEHQVLRRRLRPAAAIPSPDLTIDRSAASL